MFSTQACHNSDVSQKQVGGVAGPVIVLRPPNAKLQEASEPQRFAKLLKQAESPKAGRAGVPERKRDLSESLGIVGLLHKRT